MENKVTIFSVLSLPPECTAEQVKNKCQELLLKLHPDKNGGHEIEDYQKVKHNSIGLYYRKGQFLSNSHRSNQQNKQDPRWLK